MATHTVNSEKKYDDYDCPNCGDKLRIPKEAGTHTFEKEPHDDSLAQKIDKLEKMLMDKPNEEPKKEPKGYVPPYIEKYKCKGCGEVHKNENYEGPAVGKCDTCGEKSSKKSKGKCPYCKEGKIEPFDASEDSDIERYGEEDDEEE